MRRGFGAWHVSYAIFGFLVPGLASILLPLLVVDAGHRPFRVGSIVAAQNWGVLLAPVWGWYTDRFQTYRTTLVIGLLCLGSGFATFGMARSLPALFGASFVIGLGTGACNTVASLLIMDSNPVEEWARGIGRLQLCGALGTVLGFAVASRVPAVKAALVGSALVVPAIILGAWRLPSQLRSNRRPTTRCSADLEADDGSNLLRRHRTPIWFALFLVTWSLFSLAVSAFSALFPITMFHAFELHVRVSVDTIAVATLVSLPLYSVAGRLVSRYSATRIFSAGVLVRFLSLAMLAMLTVLHWTAALPVLLLIGLFQGIWPLLGVSSSELAALLAPGLEGTAIGLFNATGAFSSGLGAMLSGLVADVSGYRSISMWAAGVALVAFAFSLILARSVTTRIQVDETRRRSPADLGHHAASNPAHDDRAQMKSPEYGERNRP